MISDPPGSGQPSPTRSHSAVVSSAGPPLPLLVLLALLTATTLELIRSSGPLLNVAFNVGVPAVAASALATYLAPGLLALVIVRITRGAGAPTVLLVSVLMLVAARLAVQGLPAGVRFGPGLTTVALAVAVLTFAIATVSGRPGGGRAAATAMASGSAAGVGLQLAMGTWDAYWRSGLLGWSVSVVLMAALSTCAVLAHRHPATIPTRRTGRAWVLGPALGLIVMMLANPAFAASQSDVRLDVAGPTMALGLLLAGALVYASGRHRAGGPLLVQRQALPALAAVLAAAIAGSLWATGAIVLVLLGAAQLAVFAVIAGALDPRRRASAGSAFSLVGAAASASLVGLGTIMPLLVFNLDYDIPLGFPNELLLVAAALVAGAATVGRSRRRPVMRDGSPGESGADPSNRPVLALLGGAGALVLLGTVIAVGPGAPPTTAQPDAVRANEPLTLVSWNVHFGVDSDGDVDLEQIATTIEEQQPALVILQEISRGWVLGGGGDMATWLADRLDMRIVAFAPAADRQFGNTILTNLPVDNTTILALPYGQGPQNRSALSTDLLIAGESIRVTSVHLQSGDTTPTRLDQVAVLLEAEGDHPTMIIAGDFNAEPGWAEIEQMTDSGLLSAQDVAGDPSAPTNDAGRRIDWVFGRGVTFVETKVLAEARSSDHLPLVVTFTPGQD